MTDELQVIEAAAALEGKKAERLKAWQSIVLLILLGGIFLVLYVGMYQADGKFLYSLRENDVSRGLITFVVAVATVSIALVLAVYAMASNEKSAELKERFSYAKDVLATLVGILGTILGFYFGTSVSNQGDSLSIADPQIRGGQIVVHVAGGAAPYRYTLSMPGEDAKKAQPKVTKDGWIFEPTLPSLKKDDSLSIEVSDSKDKKASRSFKYSPESSADQGSTQVKPQPATPPATAPAASK